MTPSPHPLEAGLAQVWAHPRYQRNIEYGTPRSGHPEGKVKFHIADLEANLEALTTQHGISEDAYWKLKFMIHVHDTFKAEAEPDVPILHPRSHASLAREFAAEFIEDTDVLTMIQVHDANYAFSKQFTRTGHYDQTRFQDLLAAIHDWDLFLMFTIIDGCTAGKDRAKVAWFITEVRKHKQTNVDETWVL